MTNATERQEKLQAGDVFRFREGVILQGQSIKVEGEGALPKNYVPYCPGHARYERGAIGRFVVIEARLGAGSNVHGSDHYEGGWTVEAVPEGTPLTEIAHRKVRFYQSGPYVREALIDRVVIVKRAERKPLPAMQALHR